MKKYGFVAAFFALVIALSFMVPLQHVAGQSNVQFQLSNIVGVTDPCQNPYTIKTTVPINVATATTTQLVAPSGTTTVYGCGAKFTMTGTTPTALFEGGTGGTCGGSTVSLTGTFAPTAGTFLALAEGGQTQFKTAAGSGLCVVSGGTPGLQGYLIYVQQ